MKKTEKKHALIGDFKNSNKHAFISWFWEKWLADFEKSDKQALLIDFEKSYKHALLVDFENSDKQAFISWFWEKR